MSTKTESISTVYSARQALIVATQIGRNTIELGGMVADALVEPSEKKGLCRWQFDAVPLGAGFLNYFHRISDENGEAGGAVTRIPYLAALGMYQAMASAWVINHVAENRQVFQDFAVAAYNTLDKLL